jgi:hypothetical protein
MLGSKVEGSKMKMTTNPAMRVSPQDYDLLGRRWYLAKGYARSNVRANGKRSSLNFHRIVLGRMLGRTLLKKEECDHINGDKLDNRRENLRLVDRAMNGQNLTQCGPFRGTLKRPNGKWQARVKFRQVRYHCGTYESRGEAALAALRKRQEFGFLTNHA